MLTALILNGLFSLLGIVPESRRVVSEITHFKIDYTFWMNLLFVWIAGWLAWQNKRYLEDHGMKMMQMEGGGKIKKIAVAIFIIINVSGISAFVYTQLL